MLADVAPTVLTMLGLEGGPLIDIVPTCADLLHRGDQSFPLQKVQVDERMCSVE